MQSSNEMVMERPLTTDTQAVRSSIKSIVFHVHDDEELDSRLQSALSLARACSAHLELLHVVPFEAYTVSDTWGGVFFNDDIIEKLQQQADDLRARLENHLRLEDVSWNYEEKTASTVAQLLYNASLADLFVIGRLPFFRELGHSGPSLLGELLCSTRTPLCILGDRATSFDPFATAIIAWNGSFECANAVRSSVGLLSMASRVRVIRYTEGKEKLLPDTRLLEYLSRHDVHAELETHLPRVDIVTDLVNYAAHMGAAYVVMGGYSHSRAGEFLFGGVTRELLGSCPVSLVMAH